MSARLSRTLPMTLNCSPTAVSRTPRKERSAGVNRAASFPLSVAAIQMAAADAPATATHAGSYHESFRVCRARRTRRGDLPS